jgi:hypothetical protein
MRYRLIAIAVFLLSFAVVSLVTPWHRADVTLAQPPSSTSVTDRQAALDDQLAAVMTRLRCTPPQLWKATHARTLPASMVLKRDRTFTLTTVAWTYPAPAGYWTMALCAKGGH